MKPLLFSLFAPKETVHTLNEAQSYEVGDVTIRNFPDGETYLKLNSNVKDRELIIYAALDNPNPKFLPLIYFLKLAKEGGAKKIGVVFPYLPYMRQDIAFSVGEAITSKYFANLISSHVDWLLTIDPHLHRYHNLNEIYTPPAFVLHATLPIANWIKTNVKNTLIIGPDAESKQWVSEIANSINVPYLVLEKVRKGDKAVEIKIPNLEKYQDFTPVLVDDIISTGTTIVETLQQLRAKNMKPGLCIGVHALFVGDALEKIRLAGASDIITCNTVEHVTNKIDIIPTIQSELLKIQNRV